MDQAVISIVLALIGIPTAILGLKKAILEVKKAKEDARTTARGGMNMVNDSNSTATDSVIASNVGGNVEATTNNNSTIIHGDVSIIKQEGKTLNAVENSGNSEVHLRKSYTSVFAERGVIHNEKITIKSQKNGKVEGEVYLDDNNIYKLEGTFRNCILTGEFTSVGEYTDERGTINLKLISEDILSGFCSFSKISNFAYDPIRMSPYVWVAGNDENLLSGTYEFCSQCHNDKKKCCCSSPDVDMPVILKNEAQRIQSSNPRIRKMKAFSHSIGNTLVRQINEIKRPDGVHYCHFYDNDEGCCKIYDIRPTDCRLFPFDIKLDENTNEYWIGYYSDLCDRPMPDHEEMKVYAHVLRPQLFLLFPYANTINDQSVCERLRKASFERLYKLEEFIF